MPAKFWSRTNDVKDLDYFPTPPYASLALLKREQFSGSIWEPACGEYHMANVLKMQYPDSEVIATDIIYGQDFLKTNKKVDNIVTNPPFTLANDFILHCKKCATKKIAFILRNQFLESKGRHAMFLDKDFPLKAVYQFVHRVPFAKGKIDLRASNTLAFSWFVWDREWKGEPVIRWIDDRSHEINKVELF